MLRNMRVGEICISCFFFNDTATTEIYTLSLHDALPIWRPRTGECQTFRRFLAGQDPALRRIRQDDPRRRPRSEEHTSELQSRQYLVCRLLLEKKNPQKSHYLTRRV